MRTFRRITIPLLAASMASALCFPPPCAFAVSVNDNAAAAAADANLTPEQKAAHDRSTEHMRRLQLENERFLKEHSDASGKVRPDLWRKGVEQQKQMKVAPYIGAKPLGAESHSNNN